MKRITIILCTLLLPLTMMAGGVKKSRINGLLSELKSYEGVELVRLGPVSTAALKAVARLSTAGEPDSRQALALIGGVRRLAVLDYEDCPEKTRREITRKLDRALAGSDLLMEAKDGAEAVKIYAVTDEEQGVLRDVVLYAPGDCALICLFGKLSMETVGKILEEQL